MEENQMIQITDDQGRVTEFYAGEPQPASVALSQGKYGSAWQRYFSDGLWHRGKYTKTWEEMLRERNLVLIYDAPAREPKVVDYCTYHRVVHYQGHESRICSIERRLASA